MTKSQVFPLENFVEFVQYVVDDEFDKLLPDPKVEDQMRILKVKWGQVYAALESGFSVDEGIDGENDICCITPDGQAIVLTAQKRGDFLAVIGFRLG